MRARPRPALALLLAVTVVTAAGCSTSGDDAIATTLRAELDAALEQQRLLTERVADLEAALAPESGATEDPLAALDDRITGLDEALAELAGQLQVETEARGGAVAALGEEVDGLDARLADLQASVVELRGAVQELTDEVASLEAQFKAHRDDGARHD